MHILLTALIGVINVTDPGYGAIANDGVNDREEIEEALQAAFDGSDTAHFPCATPPCAYDLEGHGGTGLMVDLSDPVLQAEITFDAGVELNVHCVTPNEYETVFRIGTTHGVVITGADVVMNVGNCAARGLEILYQGDADDDVVIEDVWINNVHQVNGSLNAAGIHVRGGFPLVDISGGGVHGSSVTGACDGSRFARGIEIVQYCGASDYRVTETMIDGVSIQDVTDGFCNSDGISIATLCDDFPASNAWTVQNSTIVNAEYRSIKAQAIGGLVSNNVFHRTAYTGHHEVDCQYSDCEVSDNTFYSEGFAASSVAGMAIRDEQTSSNFIVQDNYVLYVGAFGINTYPFQFYDLTTAGGVLQDIVIRRNTVVGNPTSLIFASAPFAGAHTARFEYNVARDESTLLTYDVGSETVSYTDLCNILK